MNGELFLGTDGKNYDKKKREVILGKQEKKIEEDTPPIIEIEI